MQSTYLLYSALASSREDAMYSGLLYCHHIMYTYIHSTNSSNSLLTLNSVQVANMYSNISNTKYFNLGYGMYTLQLLFPKVYLPVSIICVHFST